MAIPQCKYIIRKGEKAAADRSNIFDWTPLLAEKDEKFEEYKGELPTPSAKSIFNEPKAVVASPDDVKTILVYEAIKKLEKEDFTAAGVPKVYSLQKIVGFDIDTKLRDAAFDYYKSHTEVSK